MPDVHGVSLSSGVSNVLGIAGLCYIVMKTC